MPKTAPALDAQTLSLLRARREMFAGAPSVLPSLHRHLRLAELEAEKPSLRDLLAQAWERSVATLAGALAPQGLAYAAAAVTVACIAFAGFKHAGASAQPLLTLGDSAAVQYALNDASSLPTSFGQRIDQKIDALTVGEDPFRDSAQHVAGAHYVLTSAPTSYDSVVAF